MSFNKQHLHLIPSELKEFYKSISFPVHLQSLCSLLKITEINLFELMGEEEINQIEEEIQKGIFAKGMWDMTNEAQQEHYLGGVYTDLAFFKFSIIEKKLLREVSQKAAQYLNHDLNIKKATQIENPVNTTVNIPKSLPKSNQKGLQRITSSKKKAHEKARAMKLQKRLRNVAKILNYSSQTSVKKRATTSQQNQNKIRISGVRSIQEDIKSDDFLSNGTSETSEDVEMDYEEENDFVHGDVSITLSKEDDEKYKSRLITSVNNALKARGYKLEIDESHISFCSDKSGNLMASVQCLFCESVIKAKKPRSSFQVFNYSRHIKNKHSKDKN